LIRPSDRAPRGGPDPEVTTVIRGHGPAAVTWADLYAARDAGLILELSHGVFRRADAAPASFPDLLAVAYRNSTALACLVSAAAVHDLTDEIPAAVQIAVPRISRPAKISFPPAVVFRFEPSTFELGLTSLEAAPGEYVRIYDPARTVLDLMRLRHRVDEPTALAALHRYLRHRDSGQLSCSSLPPRSVSTGLFCMLSTSPAQHETAQRASDEFVNKKLIHTKPADA
jgi:hypothetical protein